MKRESAFLSIKPEQKKTFENVIWAAAPYIDEKCEELGLSNCSVWTVEDRVYFYAQSEGEKGLKDVMDAFAREISLYLDVVAYPEDTRLMYHDIGEERQDKSLIRRRVFATVLKDGCADEYFRRHEALINARGGDTFGKESNFTIRCAENKYIFGYCEIVRELDTPPTAEEQAASDAWETRQLEIMDWLTDDVDYLTGESHEKMRCLFQQRGY